MLGEKKNPPDEAPDFDELRTGQTLIRLTGSKSRMLQTYLSNMRMIILHIASEI